MFEKESALLLTNKDNVATCVVDEVIKTYPEKKVENHRLTKEIKYVINALVYCLQDGITDPMHNVSRMFFSHGQLQLKTLHIDFDAYDILIRKISAVINNPRAAEHCYQAIKVLKKNLNEGIPTNNDELPLTVEYETRIKHMLYSWDDEQNIMRNMQQCQRNWDTSFQIPQAAVDYLLWIAQNAPSKQHEAYYDVYYSTDRETIEYLYQFTWGSTHRKNPPAMWRNSQMNANMYMIFVCKQPPTMYNCNNDGTLQNAFGESRWENSIVSVGMAMSLVMRAAHRMGFKTGPNKVKDLGPDYNLEWEKKLGIQNEVKAGTKRLFFGLGIGIPKEGMARWESEDTEFAIGASNGHHVSTRHREEDWNPLTANGKEKRKIDIVDIREHGGQTLVDPYGNEQVIPKQHAIKVNTVYNRDIKCIEIGK